MRRIDIIEFMKIIAHRGVQDVYPENTLEAICESATHGFLDVEFDVRRCGSGELVVIHDPDLERVAHLKRSVKNTDLTQLERYGVSSLHTILSSLPEGIYPDIDLKETGTAIEVQELLHKYDIARATIGSRHISELLPFTNESAHTPRLVAKNPLLAALRARRHSIPIISMNARLASRLLVKILHHYKFKVYVYPILTQEKLQHVQKKNVDGAYVDFTPAAQTDSE